MDNTITQYDSRLDAVFLNELYENDIEYASIVFQQFLVAYPQQIKEIEEYFAAGEIEAFRQKIHKLKPTFSFVGLTQMTAVADNIEKKCLAVSQIEEISDLYINFKCKLSDLIPVVEAENERFKNLNS